ncbi:hypothetical protein GCM10011385_33660 [Nitratireductor aestuarii]|uniref:Terpene utilization protein AtuA n=1 Tax=Nitratireductor aestuarii TaxID=1735103 RepID=A0A916W828_9HYPH|nr:acyclic terpene utilization AtuA family protein [Nitratireductor aestuarii]GGA76848.1 hypothetical protein GCM10011385_33660 [Nitratireductor aestuarii]
MNERVVRIGGASGSWGDSPMAIPQLLTAEVDYLIADYLAEITMSLLARAKLKDPEGGYPPDFIRDLGNNLDEIAARGIKFVTNAGAVNPQGCAEALAKVAADKGHALNIAVVEGDDMLAHAELLRPEGGGTLPKLLTANAYLGALPIRAALAAGADIVITGRAADSALALGILMHEFGWTEDQYDLLAAGSLVGHVLECGPQATGGIHTDWQDVPGWENIGYPIAECATDGSFVLTKPPATGGLINRGVVSEQILYEVGDPAAYILPDVVADFTNVSVEELGNNRVRVAGARGGAPTPDYKVSATWLDGHRAVATFSIVGPDAALKADRTAEALIARGEALFAKNGFAGFSSTHAEALGAEAAYPPAQQRRGTREVVLRLVVAHPDRRALELWSKEIGSVGISFAPGTTGIMGGRPRPTPVIRLLTCYVAKASLPAPRLILDGGDPIEVPVPAGEALQTATREPIAGADFPKGERISVPLGRIAYARSGDKGNSSNIALIARRAEYLPVIRREVTPQRMLDHFEGLVEGPVERFDAPGLLAVNFLLRNALGGGGIASPRIDPQGKAFGQMSLEMMVEVPRVLLGREEKA